MGSSLLRSPVLPGIAIEICSPDCQGFRWPDLLAALVHPHLEPQRQLQRRLSLLCLRHQPAKFLCQGESSEDVPPDPGGNPAGRAVAHGKNTRGSCGTTRGHHPYGSHVFEAAVPEAGGEIASHACQQTVANAAVPIAPGSLSPGRFRERLPDRRSSRGGAARPLPGGGGIRSRPPRQPERTADMRTSTRANCRSRRNRAEAEPTPTRGSFLSARKSSAVRLANSRGFCAAPSLENGGKWLRIRQQPCPLFYASLHPGPGNERLPRPLPPSAGYAEFSVKQAATRHKKGEKPQPNSAG